ncbi:MAG: hypothetical protein U0002_09560 [Thermoanaerobaculia bacterium]
MTLIVPELGFQLTPVAQLWPPVEPVQESICQVQLPGERAARTLKFLGAFAEPSQKAS